MPSRPALDGASSGDAAVATAGDMNGDVVTVDVADMLETDAARLIGVGTPLRGGDRYIDGDG